MEEVSQFKYLGQTLDKSSDDWMEIIWNIRRVWKDWGQTGKILIHEGADTQVWKFFYWTVIQAVLLFGSESWDMSEAATSSVEVT